MSEQNNYPPGFAEAAAKRGMTVRDYAAWCNRKAKEVRHWWTCLKACGWQPPETPTEFLHRLNNP